MTSSDKAANAFKALAHDLRLRLFYAVGAAGEATATMLAREVGSSPAAVSYHLGKLGEFGLLEEIHDTSRDGRERWWRLASGGLQLVDDQGVEGDLLRFAVVRHHVQRLSAFLAARSPVEAGSQTSADISFTSDMVLKLDESTADRFQGEVAGLLRRYADEPAPKGQATFVMLQGIPYES